MTTVHEAIDRACAEVGISIPRSTVEGRWLYCDTFSGKNGKNDGRVMIDGDRVTARNMQTGVDVTIHAGVSDPVEMKRIAERRQRDNRESAENARRAGWRASQLMLRSKPGTHPYLARKGFHQERVSVASAACFAELGIPVPDGAERAIVVPARIDGRISTAQVIWEDGSKRYLFGGNITGAAHRLRAGTATWLCEGFATAISLRLALMRMNRSDGILVCFHASNLPIIARKISGKVFVAADNDGHKPQDRFDGLGTGEYYARQTGKPYAIPPHHGMDINDMHLGEGIFAVQRLLLETIRNSQ